MVELKLWVANQLGQDVHIEPLVGDASFRSYYRVKTAHQSYIAMLAPPEKERTDIFVALAKAWKRSGIQVPEIWAWEPQHGFVLLTDFGDTLLLDKLTAHTVDSYYHHAMNTLLHLQKSSSGDYRLPLFDEAHIRLELSYFQEWFLGKLLNLEITRQWGHLLEDVFSHLIQAILSQPQVPIHRDYHSRNLMILDQRELGVIDFQDAMMGPITYDLASLLKDCYINWESEKITRWVESFYNKVNDEKQIGSFNTFMQWFDWVGLQRHLKVLGIFSRLKLRDNKPRYIADMPRIMNYVLEVTRTYSQFNEFNQFLEQEVLPPLQALWQQQKVA